jgi:hypothetical protein
MTTTTKKEGRMQVPFFSPSRKLKKKKKGRVWKSFLGFVSLDGGQLFRSQLELWL